MLAVVGCDGNTLTSQACCSQVLTPRDPQAVVAEVLTQAAAGQVVPALGVPVVVPAGENLASWEDL